jgi:hypothetical protein
VCTIRPAASGFYLGDDGTTIDGYTQPGASPNSNPFGQPINAVLKIVLDGSLLPECCWTGLGVQGDNNIVRGLVVQRFYGGIEVLSGHTNSFEGNFIGTDHSGFHDRGNACHGVVFQGGEELPASTNNIIGGSSPQARNLISGNGCAGVSLGPSGLNQVHGNYIGTDVTGAEALGNDDSGVYIYDISQHNRIGGTSAGQPNLIAFNGVYGVEVSAAFGAAHFNRIQQNRIHHNGDRGIALLGGGNQSLAAPVITAVSGNQVTGTACANCTIEVFSDSDAQGEMYEGTTTADGSGNWTFVKSGSLAGPNITATATDGLGNTSEFSTPPPSP